VAQIVQGWTPVTQIESDQVWTLDALTKGRDTLFKDRNPGVPPFLIGKI
jgi:hypothetical protein